MARAPGDGWTQPAAEHARTPSHYAHPSSNRAEPTNPTNPLASIFSVLASLPRKPDPVKEAADQKATLRRLITTHGPNSLEVAESRFELAFLYSKMALAQDATHPDKPVDYSSKLLVDARQLYGRCRFRPPHGFLFYGWRQISSGSEGAGGSPRSKPSSRSRNPEQSRPGEPSA